MSKDTNDPTEKEFHEITNDLFEKNEDLFISGLHLHNLYYVANSFLKNKNYDSFLKLCNNNRSFPFYKYRNDLQKSVSLMLKFQVAQENKDLAKYFNEEFSKKYIIELLHFLISSERFREGAEVYFDSQFLLKENQEFRSFQKYFKLKIDR